MNNNNNNNNDGQRSNAERYNENGDADVDTKWYKKITVEPTMFLYMFAFMLTSVVEQAFYLHRACVTNHGYSEEICNNLDQNDTIKKEVQVNSIVECMKVLCVFVYKCGDRSDGVNVMCASSTTLCMDRAPFM